MADVGTGASITFGTNAFTGQITDIQFEEIMREVFKTSHLGTTTAHTFMPGDLYDPGGIDVTILYNPTIRPSFTTAAETITVTGPIASGNTTGTTIAASGFVDKFKPGNLTLEGLMEGSMHIKFSGAFTITNGS